MTLMFIARLSEPEGPSAPGHIRPTRLGRKWAAFQSIPADFGCVPPVASGSARRLMV